MFFKCARAAASGTTPPNLLCSFIWDFTTDDKVRGSGSARGLLAFAGTDKTAAAVSSQLLSMASMRVVLAVSIIVYGSIS
jgi:hypothetical protein